MPSISNRYSVDQNITDNVKYDTIDACFEVFQLKRDANKATV